MRHGRRNGYVGALRIAAAGVLLASVAGVGAASAQDGLVVVSARASVPPGCVDTFADDLARRAARARIADDGAVHVRAQVRAQADGFRGEVELTDEAGVTRRVLEGASCEEVIDGLALVAALAIDPQADTSPRPRDAAAPLTDAGDAAGDADAADARADDASAELASADAGRSRDWSWAAGANVEMASVVPAPELGFGAFVALEAEAPGLFAPSFRVRALLSLAASVTSAQGSGRFQWALATLDGCPIRVPLGAFFSAAPCLGVDVGAILARGEGGAVASVEETRPWFALRALVRLAAYPVRWARIEVEGGPVVPFVRDEFVFQPAPTVFRPPLVFLFAGASVVARFR